ncbi:hypothetical protein [Absidia glauca]|uniref:Uncharacterized protein n=1 Tax=Absidia glauca TaxID=4829 RepID=A0A163IRW4_ABSGL|nr:hypothetical protein [Absidia glauca]
MNTNSPIDSRVLIAQEMAQISANVRTLTDEIKTLVYANNRQERMISDQQNQIKTLTETVEEMKTCLAITTRHTASASSEQPAPERSMNADTIEPLAWVKGADGKYRRPPFRSSVIAIIGSRWKDCVTTPGQALTNLKYWAQQRVEQLHHGSFREVKGKTKSSWTYLPPATQQLDQHSQRQRSSYPGITEKFREAKEVVTTAEAANTTDDIDFADYFDVENSDLDTFMQYGNVNDPPSPLPTSPDAASTREGSVITVDSVLTRENTPTFAAPPHQEFRVPVRRRPAAANKPRATSVVSTGTSAISGQRAIPDVVASSAQKNKRKTTASGSQTKRKANNP